uniref:CHR928 n=1 Tax=Arundo donax TaxID=35708 RepID=A0A0A9E2H6_ARUDO
MHRFQHIRGLMTLVCMTVSIQILCRLIVHRHVSIELFNKTR